MKFLPAALLLLLSSAAFAQPAPDFDRLIESGFTELRAAAAQRAPAAAPSVVKSAPGGVFLQSSYDGRIAYCSAAGCRLLLNSGAGSVVPAAPGSLYFTGPAGTGHCTIDSCVLLLPGVRAVLPLEAGPDGNLYASSADASWHCTPDACARAGDRALEIGSNFVGGLYLENGDFVASGAGGTFWCSRGACARIGDERLLFIGGGCAGRAPENAVFGFWGDEIWRCTPESCANVGAADGVDNFVDCAFESDGSLILNARGAAGGYRCSESGVERTKLSAASFPRPARPAVMARDSVSSLVGADGATYELDDRNRDPRSASAGETLPGGVTRTSGRRAAPLAFDAAVDCWHWQATGDDDDDSSESWYDGCRLVR